MTIFSIEDLLLWRPWYISCISNAKERGKNKPGMTIGCCFFLSPGVGKPQGVMCGVHSRVGALEQLLCQQAVSGHGGCWVLGDPFFQAGCWHTCSEPGSLGTAYVAVTSSEPGRDLPGFLGAGFLDYIWRNAMQSCRVL